MRPPWRVLAAAGVMLACGSGFGDACAGAKSEPAGSASVSTAERSKQTLHTPAEFISMMEGSPITYQINEVGNLQDVKPADFASLLWPAARESVDDYTISQESGGKVVVLQRPVSRKVERLLDEAESHFQAGRFEEALAGFQEVSKADETLDLGPLYAGDSLYRLGRYDEAVTEFRRAAEMNPNRHTTWFFLADALFALKRYHEARDAWTRALALKPYHDPLMRVVRARASAVDAVLHEERFVPKALVRREKEFVGIYVPTDVS